MPLVRDTKHPLLRRDQVVEEKSASYPGIGETLPLRSNHIDICKFASKDDNGYKLVKAKILEMLAGGGKDNARGVSHRSGL